MIIRGYRIGPLLRKTGREILDDNVPGLAAETAYYFFFSLFPLLLFLAPMLALIGDKETLIDGLITQFGTTVPPAAVELLEGVIEEVVYSEGAPGLMSLGIVLALWTGSNVFNALITALNRAFDCTEGRPFWKKRLLAIAAVVVTGVVVLTATIIMLAGPEIIGWVGRQLRLDEGSTLAWTVAQYPLAFALLVGTMWLLYRYLPALGGISGWHILVGALVATTLWIVVTLGFRWYVSSFANFNKTYGTIGGVIIMLTWMYLTMFVILAAGELVAEMHAGTGALRPRAGATYTGRLSTRDGPPRASNQKIESVEPMAARNR